MKLLITSILLHFLFIQTNAFAEPEAQKRSETQTSLKDKKTTQATTETPQINTEKITPPVKTLTPLEQALKNMI